MANNTELETLTITLNAEVGNARRNLKGVATSIKELEQTGKNADWSVFQKIKENLQDIANVDFTRVAQSLHDVVSSLKLLGITNKKQIDNMKNIGGIPTMINEDAKAEKSFDFSTVKPENTFSSIFGKTDISSEVDKLNKLFEETIGKTDTIVENLNTMFTVGEGKTNMSDIIYDRVAMMKDIVFNTQMEKQETEQVSNQWSKLKELVEGVKQGIKESSLFTGNIQQKASGLVKSIKRIALYRLIRKLLQLIVQSIKKAINNIYNYMDSIGGAVAKELDDLKSSAVYALNSFATILKPAISAISIALSALLTILGDIMNIVGDFAQALGGAFDMTNAEKSLVKFGNTAKNTLGIDELNTINQNEGLFSNLFGDPKQLDAMNQTLKDALGGLTEITGVLKEIVKPIAISLSKVFQQIWGVFGNIEKSLREPVVDAIVLIAETIGVIFDVISEIIDALNESGIMDLNPALQVMLTITDVLGGLLNTVLKPILELVNNIFELVGAIIKTVIYFISGDWDKIGDVWKKFGNDFVEGWKGVGESIKNIWLDIWNSFMERVINPIKEYFSGGGLLGKAGVDTGDDTGSHIWKGILGVATLGLSGLIVGFASGGFPEDGLFFANHNELVGQFSNGKTAVANNQEITTGIYEAVLQAMRESGAFGSRENGNIVLEIDGREIAKTVKKYNNLDGSEIISGGARYGY